jgi:hypothetical protein
VRRAGVIGIAFIAVWLASARAAEQSKASAHWWKGNLHTHSLWSDGDDYPEMIVGWYKEHGYQFLALSDHNVMLTGNAWIPALTNRGGKGALEKYLARYGEAWVERREENGRPQVRLKTLEEFRGRFEEPGQFLLIPGEEISDKFESSPIHLNATNLRDLIPPQHGNSVFEVIQNDVNAVLAQRKRTGQPMIPHINHPNFQWALTAEDLLKVRGDRFLEIYNGHPITRNNGDAEHASAERIWDILLTRRVAELRLEPFWGTAVDDSHNYHTYKTENSNPGRGWLMVRAEQLTPAALIAGLDKGDFYATSGVALDEIRSAGRELALKIKTEPGVSYKTQFIGTRKGYDAGSEPVTVDGKTLRATRKYSSDIGAVLAEVEGPTPAYRLKGDEIYVRAKVISTRLKENPTVKGDVETAWFQPLITGVK